MKKMAVLLGVMLSIGSVASATPADNYDLGKVTVDLGTSVSPSAVLDGNWSSNGFDGTNQFKGSVTVGLGTNFALQYKYDKFKGKEVVATSSSGGTETDNGSITSNEINLLYKMDKHFSAFIGNRHANGSVDSQYAGATTIDSSVGASKDYMQVGIIGQTKLGKDWTGWGVLGLGNDMKSYEFGVGYALTKNIDLDLYYSYVHYDKFAYNSYYWDKFDVSTKGWNMGVTVRF